MVFSAVSMISSFEVDSGTHDLVRVGKKKKNCMLRSTILRQFDLE